MDDTEISEIFDDLEAGVRVSDTRFDKIFPVDDRRAARVHWTPVAIALEAVGLLTEAADPGKPFRILDVGSNVGKFCLVGAASSPAHFTGVELRRPLVDVARQTARRHRIQRVRFVWSDMADLDWSEFNGVYLYNPFHENVDESIRIDGGIAFGSERFERYVKVAREKLSACRPGTRVVTFYGFGGDFPAGYERLELAEMSDRLEAWVKRG